MLISPTILWEATWIAGLGLDAYDRGMALTLWLKKSSGKRISPEFLFHTWMETSQTAKVGGSAGSANQTRLCRTVAKGEVVRSQLSESEGCILRLVGGFLKWGYPLKSSILFWDFPRNDKWTIQLMGYLHGLETPSYLCKCRASKVDGFTAPNERPVHDPPVIQSKSLVETGNSSTNYRDGFF